MKEVFPGVFREGKSIFTRNLVPGSRVYGEKLVKGDGVEYREWNPRRSKLAAAILKGLKTMPIKPGSGVLYLGAAQGTTVSHVSDIVKSGFVVAVEFSPKAMKDLIMVAEERNNILPILADANDPERYREYLVGIDVIYQDVAQPNQVEILVRNTKITNPKYTMLCVKSRSIDVSKNPEGIYKETIRGLEASGLKTVEVIKLGPYEKDHAMIISKVKG